MSWSELCDSPVIHVLFVAESPFQLGPSQVLAQRIPQLTEGAAEVHAVFRHPGDTDWLGLLEVACYLPSQWNQEGRPTSAPPELDASSGDATWSRTGMRGVYGLACLISGLKPDAIYALGHNMAQQLQVALSLLKRSVRSNIETVYVEDAKPNRGEMPGPWLSRIRGVRFDRIEVPHEVLKQHLVSCGVDEPIYIVPNQVSPLLELAGFELGPPSDGLRMGVPPRPRLKLGEILGAEKQRDSSRQVLRDRLGLPDSTIVAGTVAALTARTRLKDLIWATDLLTTIRDDFHLAIFGCGPQYARLRRFAELTEAAEHVHFLGEPADALTLFQGLDIYWHSHLRQPNPVNVLSAMAMGIPVISVLGPETSDVVKPLQTGLGVNFGARDEFARWSKYLIEQTESADRISQQGANLVRENFSP